MLAEEIVDGKGPKVIHSHESVDVKYMLAIAYHEADVVSCAYSMAEHLGEVDVVMSLVPGSERTSFK